jgi:hypothetical protein
LLAVEHCTHDVLLGVDGVIHESSIDAASATNDSAHAYALPGDSISRHRGKKSPPEKRFGSNKSLFRSPLVFAYSRRLGRCSARRRFWTGDSSFAPLLSTHADCIRATLPCSNALKLQSKA